uniref:Uncharacterized protein n=1 Tax=Paramormyrops kingsleyae TaxID=1676925 RepID=A0A3B3RDS8_9TELE
MCHTAHGILKRHRGGPTPLMEAARAQVDKGAPISQGYRPLPGCREEADNACHPRSHPRRVKCLIPTFKKLDRASAPGKCRVCFLKEEGRGSVPSQSGQPVYSLHLNKAPPPASLPTSCLMSRSGWFEPQAVGSRCFLFFSCCFPDNKIGRRAPVPFC